MHYSTILATSALAATALAAPPQHHGRPGKPPGRAWGQSQRGPVSSEECAAASTAVSTTTAYVTVTESYEEATTSIALATESTSIAEVEPITSSESTTVYEPSTTSACSTATVTYTASPTSTGTPEQCLTDEEAAGLADVFRKLIQDYSDELALDALTEDFVDYASSVNILMNGGAQYPKNITGPTFSGRDQFMAGQGSQPKIPFTTLNVFHGCTSVSVRWQTDRSANGQPSEAAMIPVIGNAIIDAVPAPDSSYNWRIQTLYSEFNSAAWIVNLGIFMPQGPVDYINQANTTNSTTTTKRSVAENISLRGPAI